MSKSHSAASGQKTALQIACLSAGLATAFAAMPAHASVAAESSFVANNGGISTTISDAYVLNASPYQGNSLAAPADSAPTTTINSNPFDDPVAQVASSPIAPLGENDTMVVFGDSSENIGGQSFESEFLTNQQSDLGTGTPDPGTYTESEVVSYINYATQGLVDPNRIDGSAYSQFLENLYYNDFQSGATPTGTIQAYEFTNGQYIGTVNPAQLTAGTPPYTGFGLTQAAIPEASPLPLLMMGSLALVGMTVIRRRKGAPSRS